MPAETTQHPRVQALLDHGEDEGCVNLSELTELLQELDLDDESVDRLHQEIDARGLDVTDDCGRASVGPTRVRAEALATNTTDALQLFLNEVSRHPLLSAEEEVELAKRIEQGDDDAKERMIN